MTPLFIEVKPAFIIWNISWASAPSKRSSNTAMAWLSLKIEAKDNTAELISDSLMDIGALSAIIEDANAETPDEQPIFGEPGDPPPGIWQQNIVSALFDEQIIVKDVMQSLANVTGLQDLPYST